MRQRSANRAAKTVTAPAAPAAPPLLVPDWFKPAIILLGVVLLFIWFSPEVADSDTWWHLKTGQYILQTHHLPDPDPFAFTTKNAGAAYPDEPIVRHFNLTHEWLSQISFILAYAAGGFTGLIMLARGAVDRRLRVDRPDCASAHREFLLVRGGGNCDGRVANRYVSDRPFLFSFILTAATFAILEYRRYLWALPPLFLFWANVHGGFFLGWIILGVYCADAVIFRGAKLTAGRPQAVSRRRRFRWRFRLLNPNFLEPLRMTMLYRQSKLQMRLWEWQHTALWPIEWFQAMLFACPICLLLAGFRVRFTDWIFYLGFALCGDLGGPQRDAVRLSWRRSSLRLIFPGSVRCRPSASSPRLGCWFWASGTRLRRVRAYNSAPRSGNILGAQRSFWRITTSQSPC